RTLSDARRSKFGVLTFGSPANPNACARHWSANTTRMFGLRSAALTGLAIVARVRNRRVKARMGFFVKSFHSDGAQKDQNLVFSVLHAPTDTNPNFRRMTHGSPLVRKAVLAALRTPPYTSKSNTMACSTSGKTNAFTRSCSGCGI